MSFLCVRVITGLKELITRFSCIPYLLDIVAFWATAKVKSRFAVFNV